MLFLLLISLVLSQVCPTYNCHLGGFDLSPTCATVTANRNVLLQVCDNPFQAYCEISGTLTSNFTCSASPIRKPILSYPGEFCMENSNCITGTCQSNTCLGLGPGLYCYTNSACDVGLYCGPGCPAPAAAARPPGSKLIVSSRRLRVVFAAPRGAVESQLHQRLLARGWPSGPSRARLRLQGRRVDNPRPVDRQGQP